MLASASKQQPSLQEQRLSLVLKTSIQMLLLEV
jgi:hypothetical protein